MELLTPYIKYKVLGNSTPGRGVLFKFARQGGHRLLRPGGSGYQVERPAADQGVIVGRPGPLIGQKELVMEPGKAQAPQAGTAGGPQVAEADGEHLWVAAFGPKHNVVTGDGIEWAETQDVVARLDVDPVDAGPGWNVRATLTGANFVSGMTVGITQAKRIGAGSGKRHEPG